MQCRLSTPKSTEFRSKLGFNQYDIALTKEQPVLKSVIGAFEGKNHKNRNIDHEIQRQKALEK